LYYKRAAEAGLIFMAKPLEFADFPHGTKPSAISQHHA
jgi:hypothetical protein